MKENVSKTNGFIMAESVMMKLGEKIGKQESHDVIHDLIEKAQKENKTFKEVIEQSKIATQY